MYNKIKNNTLFPLILLIVSLVMGVFSVLTFLFSEQVKDILPFQRLRQFHTSGALFWIIGGAAANIILYRSRNILNNAVRKSALNIHLLLWYLFVAGTFIFYLFGKYGGREYFEYPGYWSIVLLASWVCLLVAIFYKNISFKKAQPVYVWMWSTGLVFFLFTFTEANLWQIPWFRQNFLSEVAVQWKSNGSMVGAWNQMIYGTSIYLMCKISGNKESAFSKQAYFFYFLGFFNLIFNWGHHIYNLPVNNTVRHIAYAVSMTEWLIFINLIRQFKNTLDTGKKFKHHLSVRFITGTEYWIGANLLIALLMSIPAINRYTHGTYITVLHAMGTTIGINTLILMAAYTFNIHEKLAIKSKAVINRFLTFTHISLALFCIALFICGLIRGIGIVEYKLSFAELQSLQRPYIALLALSGLWLTVNLIVIAVTLFKAIRLKTRKYENVERWKYENEFENAKKQTILT